jgi:ferrous iron transport protein A
MCLSEVNKGQTVSITSIEGEHLRTHLIRLGITEGSRIECLEKIPFGPCMIRHHRQEIALGRETAKKILVREGGE